MAWVGGVVGGVLGCLVGGVLDGAIDVEVAGVVCAWRGGWREKRDHTSARRERVTLWAASSARLVSASWWRIAVMAVRLPEAQCRTRRPRRRQ